MSFVNKVALVTGGSSGIGAAIAAKFSAEGAKVVIVGRNQTKLAAVAQKCTINDNKPLVITADITNEEDVKTIVSETLNKFKKLDILINNAGVGGSYPSILSSKALKEYDTVMNTNLRSIVQLTNLAAPYLLATKGNIINISSISGLRPFITTGFAYNASKAALDHFTKTIACELASKGVRVNGINPGPVKTDIVQNSGITGENEVMFWSMLKKSTALGRISEPEEVADLVLFLSSDKACGITGAHVVIDNGSMVKN